MRIIDELNNLNKYKGNIEWEEFYDLMDIPEEEKEKRYKLADSLFFIILSLFALAETTEDYSVCLWWFQTQLTNIVIEYGRYDNYSLLYIEKFSEEYLRVTFDNEGDYWKSEDRALLGALNESNAIAEYGELADAIDSGATMKTWHTFKDNKVRPTHKEMEGKRIPIDEFFIVGGEQLLYPRDEVNCENLAEISNCRCVCHYE